MGMPTRWHLRLFTSHSAGQVCLLPYGYSIEKDNEYRNTPDEPTAHSGHAEAIRCSGTYEYRDM